MFFVFANSASSQTATILDESFNVGSSLNSDEWEVSPNVYSTSTVNRVDLAEISVGYASVNLDTYNSSSISKFKGSTFETVRTFSAPNAEINFSIWAKAAISPSGVVSVIALRDNSSSVYAGFFLSSKTGKVYVAVPKDNGVEIISIQTPLILWEDNIYTIKINHGRVLYYINNIRVYDFNGSSQLFETNLLRLQLGIFVPDANFLDAYDLTLVPATSTSLSQTATFSINRVLVTIYYLATGIENTKASQDWFYFDRTNKVLYLREPGRKEIVVLDIYGRILVREQVDINISVADLSPGVYIVSSKSLKTIKIVVP